MKTVEDIFKDLGGPAAVAEALGIKFSAATEMKRRGKIAVRHWGKLLDVCKQRSVRGVNYDVLVSHHQKPDTEEAA